MKKYISVLLAVFVFVLSMPGTKTADAAKVTSEEVSRLVTVQPLLSSKETKSASIKMHVMLENIDLNAYAKYTAEIRKNAKYGNIVFAKAAPGSQVSISAEPGVIPGLLSKPAKGKTCSESIKYYNRKKIEDLKALLSLAKEDGYRNKYTIPKDVKAVMAYVSITYHVGTEVEKDMKSSTGTYRQEPVISRRYLIFTSDEACKQAYDLMTSNSITGSIASSLGAVTKSNTKSDGKDSGGLGTAVKIGICVVVLGAIGFGAYQLFGKKGGNGGKGAGESRRPASSPQQPENFGYTPPAAGPQQTQRTGPAMNNAAGPQRMQRTGAPRSNAARPQQTQRTGAPMPNSYGPQPMQRTGSATRNASGQRPTQRPGAAKRSAAENVTYCKQCGAPMRSGSHFCKNCGARNTSNICPSCGAKLEPGDMFCGNCGMKV